MKKLKSLWGKLPYKSLSFLLLLPMGFLLTQLAHLSPQLTYKIYTKGIYSFLAGILGRFFSVFPFSVGELLIYALIIFSLFWALKSIYKIIKSPSRKNAILSMISKILAAISVVYFLFVVLCGLNYASPSYETLAGLDIVPASVEELEELCLYLVNSANTQRKYVASNSVGESTLSAKSYGELADNAQSVFTAASKDNSLFKGYVPKPKPVIASKLMSHGNITGMYFPFTFESNVNTHVPQYTIPATMLHELSHFRGFMNEADANFIAYLTSQQNIQPDFAYSGTMLALVHSTNAYYRATSYDDYAKIVGQLDQEVKNDLAASSSYWKDFETPIAEVSTKINDTYLKSNRQKEGVQSYGKMVDLLLAYYKDKI